MGPLWASLLRNRLRSALTLAGVAVAVAAMVSLHAVGQGAIRMFLRLMTRSADLLVYQRKAADLMLSSVPEEVAARIAADPQVEYASGVVLAPVSVEGADVFTLLGVEAGSPNQTQLPLVEGRAFAPGERGVLMIGAIAREVLHRSVGDSLQVYEESYRIVGVYRSDVGFQDAGGVLPLADAQAITEKPGKVSVVHVKVRDPARLGEVRERIEAAHSGLRALRTTEFRNEYLQFQAISFFASAVSLVAFLLGGFGVANTFLMAVRERTAEFGLYRAVGWSRRRVMATVLSEVLLLTGLGFLCGSVLAISGLELAARVPAWTQYVQGGVPSSLLATAFLATVLMALMAGGYPAWQAARVDPIVALRGQR